MRAIRFILVSIWLLVPVLCCAQLRRGEATVEYRYDNGQYSAVVNRLGWSEKITVRLCTADDLYGMPVNHTLYAEAKAKKAYKLLFEPVEQYLKPGDNVYYSATMMLWYCNVDALVDNDGRRLFEKYHFFRMEDIRAFPVDPKNHFYSVVLLYGGMDYDADPEKMNVYAWTLHTRDFQHLYEDVRGGNCEEMDFGESEDGTRAGFRNLKNSKGEIKFIYSLERHFSSPHTGEKALEELFRQDTRRDHEYIMHISTHTFNMPAGYLENDTPEEHYDKYMRSTGLLFSGASRTLRGETMPYNLNDGLLYAAEIARLDMSHCAMVVLGACNTALGEVSQDGILGLQTAFKEAGAHTLLMTLWSVNDKATSEFMKRFYTYLFDGKTKHESLDLARMDLMRSEDFNDPIYWAPFIMLD